MRHISVIVNYTITIIKIAEVRVRRPNLSQVGRMYLNTTLELIEARVIDMT